MHVGRRQASMDGARAEDQDLSSGMPWPKDEGEQRLASRERGEMEKDCSGTPIFPFVALWACLHIWDFKNRILMVCLEGNRVQLQAPRFFAANKNMAVIWEEKTLYDYLLSPKKVFKIFGVERLSEFA
ncbi:hypothetical protein REPUB_Repub11eG0063700 [Reevesia pubescens]